MASISHFFIGEMLVISVLAVRGDGGAGSNPVHLCFAKKILFTQLCKLPFWDIYVAFENQKHNLFKTILLVFLICPGIFIFFSLLPRVNLGRFLESLLRQTFCFAISSEVYCFRLSKRTYVP